MELNQKVWKFENGGVTFQSQKLKECPVSAGQERYATMIELQTEKRTTSTASYATLETMVRERVKG